MKRIVRVVFALLFAVAIFAGCGSGERAQLVMETDLPSGECVTPELMTAVRGVLERRLESLHVRGAEVLTLDQGCAGRIVVDWPSGEQNELVARSLQSTGLLELVEIGPATDSAFSEVREGVYLRTTGRGGMPDPAALGQTPFPFPVTVFKTILTGRSLKTAGFKVDETNKPEILVEFDEEGTRILADYTATHIGAILAIVKDNVVLTAPRIQGAIPDGVAVITGNFTREEAESIAAEAHSGAMPAPLRVLEMQITSAPD
jgi:preprotein translocase subunit SecD